MRRLILPIAAACMAALAAPAQASVDPGDTCDEYVSTGCVVPTAADLPSQSPAPYVSGADSPPGNWTSTMAQDAPLMPQSGFVYNAWNTTAPTAGEVDPYTGQGQADGCKWDGDVDTSRWLVPNVYIVAGLPVVEHIAAKAWVYINYKYCWRNLPSGTKHYWFIPKSTFVVYRSDQSDGHGGYVRFTCQVGGVGFRQLNVNEFLQDGLSPDIDPDPFHVDCHPGSLGNDWARNINPNNKALVYFGGWPTWRARLKAVNDHMKDWDWPDAHGVLTPGTS